MHWQFRLAITTADDQVAGAALLAFEGATLRSEPFLKFLAVHAYKELHTNVEVNINVEYPRRGAGNLRNGALRSSPFTKGKGEVESSILAGAQGCATGIDRRHLVSV